MKKLLPILLLILFGSCSDHMPAPVTVEKPVVDTAPMASNTPLPDTTAFYGAPDTSVNQEILNPTGSKDISRFADTTINGILFDNCDTINRLFGDSFNLIPDFDDLPSLQVVDTGKMQLLTMYMWNGSAKCSFSQYQVEYYPKKPRFYQKPMTLPVTAFLSGRGIRLGFDVAALKEKIGEPDETRKEDGFLICSYKQYKDLYFADYYFRNGKLVKFRYGYEYP